MALRLGVLVPILAALTGCGASRVTERMVGELAHGDTTHAAKSAEDLYGDDRDEALVKAMELGVIQQLDGDLEGSAKVLDTAAPLVDERRSASVADAVSTAVVNDTLGAFRGQAFEHTQVDAYRVLDHLLLAQRLDGLWSPPRLLFPQGPALKPITGTLSAADHRLRAVTYARRMTINQLKETEDANEGRRYDDDPFARVLAAAVIDTLPADERTDSDEQFAVAMLTRALTAYAKQYRQLTASGTPFRYEATEAPTIARTLHLRHLLRYDPEEAGRVLAEHHQTASAVLPPTGFGSVLVLHHAGFITRPEPLQIGIAAVGFATPKNATCISWGRVGFLVEGPGHEIASCWPMLPIPGDVVQKLLAPGGATVIGFELPAHRSDHANPALATVQVAGSAGGAATMEVLADLDAYARATLKDEQPRVLVKTLVRVVAKQAAVAVASHAVGDSHDRAAGLLAFLVNLVGSAAMTATESADLRAWNTLPNRIEGTLLDLPPGTHHLHAATATGPCDLGDVRVLPGRLTVVVFRSPDTITATPP